MTLHWHDLQHLFRYTVILVCFLTVYLIPEIKPFFNIFVWTVWHWKPSLQGTGLQKPPVNEEPGDNPENDTPENGKDLNEEEERSASY